MARQAAPAGHAPGTRPVVVKVLVALGLVLVAQALFVLCLVSAQQTLVPRNMPFGVTGPPSPVVAAAAARTGLTLTAYPNSSAMIAATDRGELYGGYVTAAGSGADTLVVVPSKSFFAQTEVEPLFLDAAHKLDRQVTVQTVKPFAPGDPIGAVTSSV